jgi:hypothetical protein
MAHAREDALERAAVELLVVDDENMRFAQGTPPRCGGG